MFAPQEEQYHKTNRQTQEVAARYTELEPFGDGWSRGPCPKCYAEDAFYVYPHGAWACDACGEGGSNADDLEAAMGGLDAIDALDADSKELPSAPAYPIRTMPRACRKLVSEAAASIGCPPEFVAVPMLVALGSAIGNSRVLKLKDGWEEGAAIYAAIVADPGEKKTPAAKEALWAAEKAQAAFREHYSRKLEEYEQAQREWEVQKRDAQREGYAAPAPPEKPLMERTVVEDTTVEALALVLRGTPRGVLATRDELSGWARAMDQYKQGGRGADRQFWLSAWSNRQHIVDRKGREEPLILPRPFVGVFGAIQPGVLPELGEGREDGLLDRFLFAYPEPLLSQWSDDEISAEARVLYESLYLRLRVLHMPVDEYGDPEPVKIFFSPAAKDLFKRAVNELRGGMYSPGFPARLKGPYAKLEAYMARLCLILAVARAADEGVAERVEGEDVLNAVALIDYFMNMARRVYVGLYGENAEDRLAEDVARFLKQRGGHFKGEPYELHEQLSSLSLPDRPAELSKKLKAIASRTPALRFESGNFWRDGQSRRYVELSLENGVKGVNGVKDKKG